MQFANPPEGQSWDHWTKYTASQLDGVDIKDVWEPARFGWANRAGRAYLLTKEEIYAETFWGQTEAFFAANPPMLGPQWASGQEVALRLITLCFTAGLLCEAESSTQARKTLLAGAIAAHAQRVPSTLEYAQGQTTTTCSAKRLGCIRLPPPARPPASGPMAGNRAALAAPCPTNPNRPGRHLHSAQHQLPPPDAAKRPMGQTCGQKTNWTHFPPETLRPLAAATRWLLALLDRKSGGGA